jgi:hypothetical protein
MVRETTITGELILSSVPCCMVLHLQDSSFLSAFRLRDLIVAFGNESAVQGAKRKTNEIFARGGIPCSNFFRGRECCLKPQEPSP